MPTMPTSTEPAPTTGPGGGAPGAGAGPPSPSARRLASPRWLDLRLVVGVILVAVPVAVGARVMAASDDALPVVVAAADLAPGQQLTPDVVDTRDVRLGENHGHYLTDVEPGQVVVRAVGRGELVPVAAVADEAETGALRYVTLPLPGTEAPAGLAAGDLVDIWRVFSDDSGETVRLLADVSVVGVSSSSGGLADSAGQVRVTVALDVDMADGDEELDVVTGELVSAARAGLVYLTGRPAGQR